jgi:hypothetical protein
MYVYVSMNDAVMYGRYVCICVFMYVYMNDAVMFVCIGQ